MAHAFALSGTNLISFDTASPTAGTTIAISNLAAGETLVGIDFRPQNGLLYGLGVNAGTNTATLYTISTRTGFAGVVGNAAGLVALATAFADPAFVGYGFDFNPLIDQVRVTDSTWSFRIDPNTGTAIDGNFGIGGGGIPGIQPDVPINGGTTAVDGAAYTNNQPNSTATTLYTLDGIENALFRQSTANGGTQISELRVSLGGGSTIDFSSVGGFDIPAGVNTASSNAAVQSGYGYALLNTPSGAGFYSIDLATGSATFIGTFLGGTTPVTGLAVQNGLGGIPAVALSADGASLLRFNTAAPGTVTLVLVGAITAGETLIGIDFRPNTGQLFAFGVNATADTGTLYLVDPQTGAVAAFAGIAFGVDLPASGYGFDFDPTTDRIRITTDTGLNFRVDPRDGTLVAMDSAINGETSGVSAAAYTNSYGQSSGGATTLYTLDASSDALFIQSQPNAGIESSRVLVTLNGSPLDFTGVNGFDIPASVGVSASGAPAIGFGYAGLTVGGVTSLYAIDLTTGAATNLGPIGGGALAGLTLANAPSAPAITSGGGGISASLSITENGTAVTTVSATDGDWDAVSYAIAGGADAARFRIDAATGVLVFLAAPDFEAPADADHDNSYVVQVRATDGSLADIQTITVSVTDIEEIVELTPGPDDIIAPADIALFSGRGGVDTVRFGFKLTDATVTFSGNRVVIDSTSSHTVLIGFERFVFTDGTVDNADGNILVDDLFYCARNHDVWNAHADADLHYAQSGWHEGRDPNAFFSTGIYLASNPDVKQVGVDPLAHFHQSGWQEGRVPSLAFDPAQYLAANPDVAAAHIDPLAHFLGIGASEGRQPIAGMSLITANGFDYAYYLANNADVEAAGVDPFRHFQSIGWQEGRNPNVLFDVSGYLVTYADVRAAGINPLDHYNAAGWHEGRDPSVGFDTTAYLAANSDVTAAHVNPLVHYLMFGAHEGRAPEADGIWG